MKNGIIRQILALILAMMMIAGMLPAAFASDEAGYDVQGDAAAAQPVPEGGSGETKETSDKTEETETGSKTVYRAFEVSLQKDGEDLDVEGEFRVTVDTGLDVGTLVPEGAERTGVTFTLYHIHGDQVDIIEDADVDENGILTFTTPNFSTFVLKYTVDFAFEAEDGTVYEFTLPGGGCISIRELAQALGIVKDDPETEADEVQAFIDNIENVTFSSPELVFIGNAEADYTVGQVKEAFELECEYSAELTEEEIEEINAQVIKAGDWAVISLQPFTSDETLTITMKDGKTYTVQVTDAQIKKTVISDSGDTWEITVTYGDDAQIPDGSELRVIEIKEDDDEYSNVREELKTRLGEESEKIPSSPVLFDISIWNGNQKVEPAEGSKVLVEVKFIGNSIKGMYTDDDSPILINDKPIADDKSEIEKQVQVLHLTENNQIDFVETEDTITSEEVVSSFTTDSFSDWLLYLDEDLTSINVTTADSITLRPYTEWIWKHLFELDEYQNVEWVFPDSDWEEESEGGVTLYTHKTNRSQFRAYSKEDDQLNETYTVVTSVRLNAGTFVLQTADAAGNNKSSITVNVTQGAPSGKPGTIGGITGLTVNLFDYDVPTGDNGQLDFTHSGNLDSSGNTAANPLDETVNNGHTLKFLGWGASGDGYGVNSYREDNPVQGIVRNQLNSGFPVLNNGEHLDYLFNTSSQNSSVYAFPGADGLFMMDGAGYYYYNSNTNYAEYNRAANRFVLYAHTYSQETEGSDGINAKPIGFFPFHEYDENGNQGGMNHNQNLNHHFGMSMEEVFEIPKNRMTAKPGEYGPTEPIIYEFSGDDDLWVFVDDQLVLDIGGIHQPVSGTINFTTGDVSVYSNATMNTTVNMLNTDAFAVGTHTFRMFYIERGGCDSNLSVRFNLPLILGTGNVQIEKMSAAGDPYDHNANTGLAAAVFGIWEKESCQGEPYAIATSNNDGLIFKGLPVRTKGQVYYLKEMIPPEGYLLDQRVYTLRASDEPDGTGYYTFGVSGGNIEHSGGYPIIRNQHESPIKISVQKIWQDADGNTIDPPENSSLELTVKRTRTYADSPLYTINLYRLNANGQYVQVIDNINAYSRDILEISYVHAPVSPETPLTVYCGTENGSTNVLSLSTNADGSVISTTYTVNPDHANAGSTVINIGIPNSFIEYCYGEYYNGVNPEFSGLTSRHTSTTDSDTGYSSIITLPKTENGVITWKGESGLLDKQEKINNISYQYKYYVVEDNVPYGFEVIYLDKDNQPVSDPISLATNEDESEFKVVNRQMTTDVTLKKVSKDQLDAANPKTLPGAAFRIEKYTDNTFETLDTSWGKNGAMSLPDDDDDNDGTFLFKGLPTGFYKIVETVSPGGYVKLSEDPIFEVRMVSTQTGTQTERELKIVLLDPADPNATNYESEMLRVNEFTILFGNPPGMELPKTGGQGTELFTILGGMITAAAGAVLLRRRKRQSKNN